MLQLYTLLSSLASLFAQDTNRCSALKSLEFENTTILDTSYVVAGSNLTVQRGCGISNAVSTTSVCRVQAVVKTSSTSEVYVEAWLPDTWFGRFLAIGNGGLAGCIDYLNLDYGGTLHFASIASDNGHTGFYPDGTAFLNKPEVINDFAFRAIHVEALLGKQLTAAYYERPPHKSYYLGCSTGGRQGFQAALRFPEDFDGILAGAPAIDFNHLLGWEGVLGRFAGAPGTPLIPAELWPTISQEILDQCDDLDGVRDGIITDPDTCVFRPEELLCTRRSAKACLTAPQVAALRRIYSPLFGTHGQLLYPQYDLGAEADGSFAALLSGDIFPIVSDWYKYAVFNDTNHTFENFSVRDIEFADTINPGGIATWDGDLSAFRAHGGKLLTYHGRRDELIASSNSIRMYNLVSSALSLPNLDEFYRLFLVPGMGHCTGGRGAWEIGQYTAVSNAVNDSAHNVLLALVDWVEGARAPDVVTGIAEGGTKRVHCRYPQRSVFDGQDYVCE